MDFYEIIKAMESEDCGCLMRHRAKTEKIHFDGGTLMCVGEILECDGFGGRILMLTDRNSLPFALVAKKSMDGYDTSVTVLDAGEIAGDENVSAVIRELDTGYDGIVAVGDGGLADIARIASYRCDAPLCIVTLFPTGYDFMCCFAELMKDGKVIRVPAKAPDILIADKDVISAVPKEKKAEALSSLALIYPTLIDVRTNALMKDSSFCEKSEAMLRFAADSAFDTAYAFDGEGESDEIGDASETLFESLMCAGLVLGMLDFDASEGCASVYARFLKNKDCAEGYPYSSLRGAAALRTLEFYRDLLILFALKGKEDAGLDGKLRELCGDFYTSCPDIEAVSPDEIEAKWENIRDIIGDMPTFDEIKDKFVSAGLAAGTDELGIDALLAENAFICAPYTSDVLTLARLLKKVDFTKIYRSLEEIKESETEANDGVEIDIPDTKNK